MSKIWLTADEHYHHGNCLLFRKEYKEFREDLGVAVTKPFRTLDEMHRLFNRRHNEVVAPEDTVYHLGDFAFGPGAKSWTQLEPIIRGLNGKHILILGNHCLLDPFKYVEAGFESVHTSLRLGEYLLIHDPAIAGVLPTQLVLHGHTHNLGINLAPNTYCVCVDVHNFYPVPLDQIDNHFSSAKTV